MTVELSYWNFWSKLLTICDAANLSISPRSSPFKIVSPRRDTAEITIPKLIHLRDWPQRSGATEKLHILIDGNEIVTRTSMEITNSWVKVNYFELNKDEARPVESIHYDFESPAKNAHPIFHAQLCSDLIADEMIEGSDTFQKYSIRPKRINRIKTIKIPTAHMGITSVLNCLIADHVAHKLPDVIALVKSSGALPRACAPTLHTQIGIDGHAFRSFGWYP